MFTILPKHGKFRLIESNQLRGIPVPTREAVGAGRRWEPIQHGALVNALRCRLDRHFGEPGREQFCISNDGAECIGAFQFSGPNLDVRVPGGTAFAVGFSHANDRSRALRLALGYRVLVCSNGVTAAYGNAATNARHLHVRGAGNLEDQVNDLVDRYLAQLDKVADSVEDLAHRELSNTESERLFVQLGRRNVLSWKHVGNAVEDWYTPRHAEFSPRTAWSWYNCVNEQTKSLPVARQPIVQHAAFRLVSADLN